ncbi:MAG: hypothetical protein AAGI27_17965 [Pseudomonadota bacterium]
MSDDKKTEATEGPDAGNDTATSANGEPQSGPKFGDSAQSSGPNFEPTPDPLAGVKKAGGDAWKATEGKTVSMRTYLGSIAAVIVLMMLARCGG